MPITVSYATTDEEAVAIHHFLCKVAAPFLPGQIDPEDSIREVWRVVNEEIAIVAWDEDGTMLGTVGLIRVKHWWGKGWFLSNRWAFTMPGARCWAQLLKEARGIARELNVECMIVAEARGRVTIINKSQMRGNSHVRVR